MRIINTEIIKSLLVNIIDEISCNIEPSACYALKNSLATETNSLSKFALEKMLENAEYAKEEHIPVCQDTGMCIVFLEIGNEIYLEGEFIEDAINTAVSIGYKNLRKSVLDPVSRINTNDNAPAIIHTKFTKGTKLKMSVMLKGFGSENMGAVYMLNPAQGLDEAKRLIVKTVKNAGSNPCPPIIVGVGLGGTIEYAPYLAKKSLFRKIGSQNADFELNEIEKELLNEINSLNIGAQGFGGKNTALGVFIEKYPTHISSLPVAINICCHCSRIKVLEI